MNTEVPMLGIGYYTAAEAARLLRIPVRNINRWLGGYSYRERGAVHSIPPLWEPQLDQPEGHIELGFRDLIELRFIKAFIDAGLGLKTVRHCIEFARECVDDKRPFSTQQFLTDGKTIFLESAQRSGETELLDLKRKQYTIKKVIEQSFKDLDIADDSVKRWRPFSGKESIVIDPERVFGQPIVSHFGVPTIVLAQAIESEGTEKQVSRLYEVPVSVIRDAIRYEESLERP